MFLMREIQWPKIPLIFPLEKSENLLSPLIFFGLKKCESAQNLTSDSFPSEKGPWQPSGINFGKLGLIPTYKSNS